MTRIEREAYRAGRQWLRDNRERKDDDLQSYAMDLAQASGLDADWVYEGMVDESDFQNGRR